MKTAKAYGSGRTDVCSRRSPHKLQLKSILASFTLSSLVMDTLKHLQPTQMQERRPCWVSSSTALQSSYHLRACSLFPLSDLKCVPNTMAFFWCSYAQACLAEGWKGRHEGSLPLLQRPVGSCKQVVSVVRVKHACSNQSASPTKHLKLCSVSWMLFNMQMCPLHTMLLPALFLQPPQ